MKHLRPLYFHNFLGDSKTVTKITKSECFTPQMGILVIIFHLIFPNNIFFSTKVTANYINELDFETSDTTLFPQGENMIICQISAS